MPSSCHHQPQDHPAPQDQIPADVVLASVRLPGDPDSRDVHVRNGRVSAITPAGERPGGFTAAEIQVLDLEGRFLIPGLWDEHVHMTQWALAANRIDLSGAASARAAVELVRNRMTAAGRGADRTMTVV